MGIDIRRPTPTYAHGDKHGLICDYGEFEEFKMGAWASLAVYSVCARLCGLEMGTQTSLTRLLQCLDLHFI